MLEHLFGSKTRVNLLRVFFRDPDKVYFVRELTRVLDVQINAIRRELDLLVELGIVKETTGTEKDTEPGGAKKKYYKVDTESFLYSELKALIIRAQLMEQDELIREIIKKAGKVQLFLVTGRFTGDKRSPVDLMLVGDIKEQSLAKIVGSYEKKLGFDIRYTTYTHKEYFERKQMMDKFTFSILEADYVKVVDTLSV